MAIIDMTGQQLIQITRDEYEFLLETEMWVRALEAAGVDSWEGIPVAQEYFEEMNNAEESGD